MAISCKPWQYGIQHGGRPSWKSWATPCPDCAHSAENDFPALLALYKSNPFYLSISQEGPPTLEDCQEDAAALPPGRGKEHKLFLGLFQESVLAAVLDLVEGYPEEGTLYLGLLELAGPLQGKGLGTHIFSALSQEAGAAGFQCIRLACLEENLPGTGLLGRHGL